VVCVPGAIYQYQLEGAADLAQHDVWRHAGIAGVVVQLLHGSCSWLVRRPGRSKTVVDALARDGCAGKGPVVYRRAVAALSLSIAMSPVVLVTGGSRGIGAATALLAARHGFSVAVNYQHNAAAANGVVNAIHSAGGRAIAVQANVADESQVAAMFEQVDAQLGTLGALVNNAGIVDRAERVDAMDAQRLRRMFDTNVLGSFFCARQAIRRMSTRHGGTGGAIVNVSSVAARLGGAGQYVDYAASKGAIDTFTVGLARELATEGIRVNGVRPGIIETDIHASGGEPDRAHRMAPQVPMQRAGSAAEVAQAILWLLGENAGYTTGAMIDVAGGR
jgi:NAD(P)-dependent dehydrogenase (short-subunit alcohol dehydrogenase family)